jgi:hypothetical protein
MPAQEGWIARRTGAAATRDAGGAGTSAGSATGGGIAVPDDGVQRIAVSPLDELRQRPS